MLETSTHKPAQSATEKQPAPEKPEKRQRTGTAAQESVSLTETADQALQSINALYTAVDGAVQQQMQSNTYATLGVAAGVGFVLGGGLASPMGQMLLRVSVRAFGPPLVNGLLHNALERAQLSPRTEQKTGPR